jgi:predicted transcriptional regulator
MSGKKMTMAGLEGVMTLPVARAYRVITQVELAEATNVPQRYISEHESGDRNLKPEHRIAIEKELQLVGRIKW